MENSTMIYWLTRLDAINGFCDIAIPLLLIAFGMTFVYATLELDYEEEREAFSKKMKNKRILMISLALFFALVTSFLPTKNEMILIMVGSKTLDYVQQDSSLAKLPYQTTEMLSKMLDEKIKELNK